MRTLSCSSRVAAGQPGAGVGSRHRHRKQDARGICRCLCCCRGQPTGPGLPLSPQARNTGFPPLRPDRRRTLRQSQKRARAPTGTHASVAKLRVSAMLKPWLNPAWYAPGSTTTNSRGRCATRTKGMEWLARSAGERSSSCAGRRARRAGSGVGAAEQRLAACSSPPQAVQKPWTCCMPGEAAGRAPVYPAPSRVSLSHTCEMSLLRCGMLLLGQN
jgi:hypothetical protein